ncbi:hypothetical protein PCC7418_3691 [Halothece sp. PCC 7418]|uniref:hypothetical protein n=1 Tax=Halothece sp. (strain PCC 7418) TaxID=65093 RepID=UPI0002A05ECF|nr:hypothetical protein [Halothece sp. PCC 7418]AFZ45797.1 hypothetical protein PCC7418_3691 [Halothece sp. PCC 7418]
MSSQPEKIKPKININESAIKGQPEKSLAKRKKETPVTDRQWGGTNQFPHQPFPKPQTPSKMSKSAPVIQREIRRILPKLRPEQRREIADELIAKLQEKGIDQQRIKQNLSLTTINPQAMNTEQISQVVTFAYQHDPEAFEAVLTKPKVVQFLSNPILSAIVGIMAAKWLKQ